MSALQSCLTHCLQACGEACEALAAAIGEGNQHQVDGLITALKLMMPPSSGAEQAVGPPRDDFILRTASGYES